MQRVNNIFIITLLFLFTTFRLIAQTESTDTPSVQTASDTLMPDEMPYFIGCTNFPDGSAEKRACSNQTLVTFIAKNVMLPQKSDIVGTVYVSFEVDENGRVLDPKILRGLSTEHNEAALKVVSALPTWEPAKRMGKSVRTTMKLPIKFSRRDESEFSNGFQLTWGTIKSKRVSRSTLQKMLGVPILIRDETGATLNINELLFERERRGKVAEAQSNGVVNKDMTRLVKKLKVGDVFTVTATVQKKGQFFYVDRSFNVE
jgi:TonB family protein